MRITHANLAPATNKISRPAYRNIIEAALISLSETSPWFFKALEKFIQNGLTFSVNTDDGDASFGIYDHGLKRLSVHTSLARSIQHNFTLGPAVLRQLLLHEMTHANDRLNGLDTKELEKGLRKIIEDADKIFAALSCIYQHQRVNASALDELAPLFQRSTPVKQFGSLALFPRELVEDIKQAINNLGAFRAGYGRPNTLALRQPYYITKLFQDPGSRKHQLTGATYNLAELRQATIAADQGSLRLWTELTEGQRNALAGLYSFRRKVETSLTQDACYPQFQECIASPPSQNCTAALMKCQDPVAAKFNVMELRAVRNEIFGEGDLSQMKWKRLCANFPNPSATKNRLEWDLIASSILMALFFSFTEEIVANYLKYKAVSHRELKLFSLKLLVVASLSYTNFATQVGLLCIIKIVEIALAKLQPKHPVTTKLSTALTGAVVTIPLGSRKVVQELTRLALSSSASLFGKAAAKQVSHRLEWVPAATSTAQKRP